MKIKLKPCPFAGEKQKNITNQSIWIMAFASGVPSAKHEANLSHAIVLFNYITARKMFLYQKNERQTMQ